MTLEEYEVMLKLLTKELHKFRENSEVRELRAQLRSKDESIEILWRNICSLVKAWNPSDEVIDNMSEPYESFGWVKHYLPGGKQYKSFGMDWNRE